MSPRMDLEQKRPSRHRAIGQALLVTFLWSTSWVLIKVGLADLPALTFAGLRYTLAFFVLLPFALRQRRWEQFKGLSKRTWLQLLLLGVLFYALTQGAQFLGLSYLPAITVNLMLSFTVIVVVVGGIGLLGELPTKAQWAGTAIFLVGVTLFFYPPIFPRNEVIGLIIVLGGVLANAFSSILGRGLNRSLTLDPLLVTVASMGVGALVLLAGGLLLQGLPSISLLNWGIIAWLAIVNSAFAFTLWNNSLRTLSAMESTLINNTMMIQIPILAWLFLDEDPTALEITGMVIAGLGILIVQLRGRQATSKGPN